jgi:predicted ATPase
VVIIEGPDGGGKTTLVKRLHEDLGIELSQEAQLSKAERNESNYRSKDAVRKRTYVALLREVAGRKSPLLYDRLFFSELIYSEAYGREVAFSYHEQVHIGRVLNAFKVPVVFCVPPLEDILKKNLVIDEEQGMDSLSVKITKVYSTYLAMGSLLMARKRDKKPMVGRHGLGDRTARDYALPPVIWYDYNKGEDYGRIKTEVMKYIAYRALRSQNWH